jgi:hypothetical protein
MCPRIVEDEDARDNHKKQDLRIQERDLRKKGTPRRPRTRANPHIYSDSESIKMFPGDRNHPRASNFSKLRMKFTAAMAIPAPKSTPASTRFEPPPGGSSSGRFGACGPLPEETPLGSAAAPDRTLTGISCALPSATNAARHRAQNSEPMPAPPRRSPPVQKSLHL